MKSFNKIFDKFFIIFILFFILLTNLAYSIKIKNKESQEFFNQDPTMADSNRIPIIHIHMEDHDSDPINFRRFDGERKTYRMRLEELHEKYDNEKKAMINVITLQLSKIAHLTDIADATQKMIDSMVPPN